MKSCFYLSFFPPFLCPFFFIHWRVRIACDRYWVKQVAFAFFLKLTLSIINIDHYIATTVNFSPILELVYMKEKKIKKEKKKIEKKELYCSSVNFSIFSLNIKKNEKMDSGQSNGRDSMWCLLYSIVFCLRLTHTLFLSPLPLSSFSFSAFPKGILFSALISRLIVAFVIFLNLHSFYFQFFIYAFSVLCVYVYFWIWIWTGLIDCILGNCYLDLLWTWLDLSS